MTARVYVAVVGPAECGADVLALAEAVGERLARRGAVLVTPRAGARGGRRGRRGGGSDRQGGIRNGVHRDHQV